MRTLDPEIWYKNIKKSPLDDNFELRLRSSCRDAFKEYVRNSSVKGGRYLTDRNIPGLVRWCYVCILVIATTVSMSVVINICLSSLSQSRVSVRAEDIIPVSNVDFPAVGLCTSNRFTKKYRDDYANYLHALDKNNTFTLNEIKRNLLAFLGVINLSVTNYNPQFLNYLKEKVGETNVTNIIYKLSPKCESLLVRCSWDARLEPCDKLFAIRITEFGFCCIFNSRYLSIDKDNPVFRATRTGADAGLQVVMRDDSQPFAKLLRPTNDVQIILFDGNDHPLSQAGVIRVYSSGRNTSMFLALRARMRLAEPELAGYEDTWLGCGSRSWSHCVSECRARTLKALCLCTPIDQPSATICSLEHLECLAKYREKLKYFYPGENAHDSLREEKANAVQCQHCILNCNVRRYTANVDVVPYGEYGDKLHRDYIFMRDLELINSSVIHVFFKKTQQEIQILELNDRWYESLIAHSSLSMSLAGVTGVSLLEVLYHVTVMWVQMYQNRWRTRHTRAGHQ